jgi:hypothetical protein
MKVEIKVVCDSIEEAAVSLAKLAEGQRLINGEDAPAVSNESAPTKLAVVKTESQEATPPAQQEADAEPAAAEEPVAKEAPKKRGRKSQAEALAALEPADDLEPTSAPVADQAPLTVDDARAALQKVMDKFGMAGATTFIAEQGFKRVTEIPAEKIEAFVTACNQKAA